MNVDTVIVKEINIMKKFKKNIFIIIIFYSIFILTACGYLTGYKNHLSKYESPQDLLKDYEKIVTEAIEKGNSSYGIIPPYLYCDTFEINEYKFLFFRLEKQHYMKVFI